MTALEVKLGEVLVGTLERFENEEHRFVFDEAWLAAFERPVLGQIFEDYAPRAMVTSGIPCWFAHLLPQGPLMRMIAREARVEPDDYFDILKFLGADLPGAVVMTEGAPRPYRGASARLQSSPKAEGKLRFAALSGAQWKLSVHEGERGLVVPLEGGAGSWIAKFHSPGFKDLPRVEFATMTWAKQCKIEVPPFRLGDVNELVNLPEGIPTGDGKVFLIERFDRRPGGVRVHMEDFGQVLDKPPGDGPGGQFSGRYEHIAAVLARLAPAGDQDIREFCKRLVFCILAGNGDAHLKNWTILYPHGRSPRLSPAYDLISTVLYKKVEDCLALDLAGAKRFEDVRLDSFRLFAQVAQISFDAISSWVRQDAEIIRSAWHENSTHWLYTTAERVRIEEHLARVPLGR